MTCPSFGSQRVYPSRRRNTIERLRHRVTDRQPFRCHDCAWRRWQQMAFTAPDPDVIPDDLRRVGRRTPAVFSVELDSPDPADRQIPVPEQELDPLDPIDPTSGR